MAHQKKTATLSEWANSKYEGLVRQFDGFANESFFLRMEWPLAKKSNLVRQFLVLVESWLQSKSCPLLVQWIYNVQDPVGKPKSLDLSYFLARYSFCSWKCMWTMDKSGWKICREVNIEACGSLPHRKSLHSLHLQFLIQLVLSCLVLSSTLCF